MPLRSVAVKRTRFSAVRGSNEGDVREMALISGPESVAIPIVLGGNLMNEVYGEALHGIAMLAVACALLAVGKFVKDRLTPYSVESEVANNANLAASLSLSGYLGGIVIVTIGAVHGPIGPLLDDVLSVLGWGFFGIVLLNLSRIVNDRLILSEFDNAKEIATDRNSGTGAVEMGSYIASGLIVAGAIHGEGGGIPTALVFFALGQLALILFSRLYDWATPYSIHAEIERDNTAAGIAFGGNLIALGLIILAGSWGTFESWPHNLGAFFIHTLAGCFLLPILRVLLDRLLLPSIRIDHALAADQNAAVGVLELAVLVSFSALFVATVDLDPLVRVMFG